MRPPSPGFSAVVQAGAKPRDSSPSSSRRILRGPHRTPWCSRGGMVSPLNLCAFALSYQVSSTSVDNSRITEASSFLAAKIDADTAIVASTVKKLLRLRPFSAEQLYRIIGGSAGNQGIYGCRGSRTPMKTLLEDANNKVSHRAIRKYLQAVKSWPY